MANAQQLWISFAIFLFPVLFAISLHEAAHGYVARYFGDPTAAGEGRISINPLRHIDPIGTILLPMLAYALIDLPFGYAKPVPVDVARLRNPRWHAALVAFAGPAANLAMGLGWTVLGVVLAEVLAKTGGDYAVLGRLVQAGILVNAAMFVFNMIPLPPLDGGEIMLSLLPRRLAYAFNRLRFPRVNVRKLTRSLRRYLPAWLVSKLVRMEIYDMCIFAVFLLLLKFHVLDNVLIRAVTGVTRWLAALVSPLYGLLA